MRWSSLLATALVLGGAASVVAVAAPPDSPDARLSALEAAHQALNERLTALESRVDAMLSRLQHADASAKDMVGKVEARLDAFERGMNQMYAGRSPLRALDLVEPSRELSAAERAVLVEIGSAMERIWDTQRPQEPFGALTSAQRAMWDSLRGEFARGTFGTRWPTAEQDLAGFAAELCADLSGALGDREWVGRLSADRMEAKDVLGRYAGREDGRAARTVIAALQTGAVVDAKSALLAWRRATNR